MIKNEINIEVNKKKFISKFDMLLIILTGLNLLNMMNKIFDDFIWKKIGLRIKNGKITNGVTLLKFLEITQIGEKTKPRIIEKLNE